MTKGSRPAFLELLERQRSVGERFAKQVETIQKGLAEAPTPKQSAPPHLEVLRESLEVFAELRKMDHVFAHTGVEEKGRFKVMVMQFSMWFEMLSASAPPAAEKGLANLRHHLRTTLNSIGRGFDLELITPLTEGLSPSEELNRPQYSGRYRTENGSEFLTGRSYRPRTWGLQSIASEGHGRIEMPALYCDASGRGMVSQVEDGMA